LPPPKDICYMQMSGNEFPSQKPKYIALKLRTLFAAASWLFAGSVCCSGKRL